MPAGDGRRNPHVARARLLARAALASIVASFLVSAPVSARTLRIVATTSDLASLAGRSGRSRAGRDDHSAGGGRGSFEPRPSDLARLKGASIVIRVGLGYDHWLDKLLAMHGDADVNRGGAGYVDASVGIPLLEVKGSQLDPTASDGHAHGLANPHYWLDPKSRRSITGGIAEASIRVRAGNGESNRSPTATVSSLRPEASLAEWNSWPAPPRAPPHRLSQHVAVLRSPLPAQHRRCDRSQGRHRAKPARLGQACLDSRKQKVRVILHEPFEPEDARSCWPADPADGDQRSRLGRQHTRCLQLSRALRLKCRQLAQRALAASN